MERHRVTQAATRQVRATDPVVPPGADAVAAAGATPGGAFAVVLAGALVTGGVLVAASLVGGAATPEALSDPGPLTRWGVLAARTAYDVSALGTVGVLVVAVFLLSGTATGFGPDGGRLLRVASWWAAAWFVTASVTALLTLSRAVGAPVGEVLAPDVLPLILGLEQTRALLSSAWLALIVAVGARWLRTPVSALLLLVGAGSALIMPLLTGHARHGEAQALTAASLSLHVVAAAVWAGGLGALVVHLRRSPAALGFALPRYSAVALGCFAAVGVSGVVTGWPTFASVDQVWSTPYGQLLLAKVAALGVLGAFGYRHRRRTIAAVVDRRPRAFLALAAGELVVMAATAALAVALSNSAPPPRPGGHAAGPEVGTVVTAPVR